MLCWGFMAAEQISPEDHLGNKVFDPILASKKASNLLIIILVVLAAAVLFALGLLLIQPISPEALQHLSQSALDAIPAVPFSR